MRITTHLELLKTDAQFRIEQILRAIKPYSKDRDIDNEGNELIFNKKTGNWELINKAFIPFWEAAQ